MPDIDISAFSFVASIDWVDLAVQLPAPSQGAKYRNRLRMAGLKVSQARPQPGERPESCRAFFVRVQDPPNPGALLHALQLTNDDVQVVGVEIAVDAFHRDHDSAALLTMTERFYWHQATRVGHPRISSKQHHGGGRFPAIDVVHQALREGFSINAGHKGADITQRWYLKRDDAGQGLSRIPLPDDQHRARAEITLVGLAVPFRTLDAWRNYDFRRLQNPFFTWRKHVVKQTEPVGTFDDPWAGRDDWGAWGGPEARVVTPQRRSLRDLVPTNARLLAEQDKARAGHRRRTRPNTTLDTDLNVPTRVALRKLARMQQDT